MKFQPGDNVRYVPYHAYGRLSHKDCEDGVVSSVECGTIFVKFNGSCTAQGCRANQLYKWETPDTPQNEEAK